MHKRLLEKYFLPTRNERYEVMQGLLIGAKLIIRSDSNNHL